MSDLGAVGTYAEGTVSTSPLDVRAARDISLCPADIVDMYTFEQFEYVDLYDTISGVNTQDGAAKAALVRIHRRSDGRLIAHTVSSAATGAYALRVPSGMAVYAVGMDANTDPPTGSLGDNAKVYDGVVPG